MKKKSIKTARNGILLIAHRGNLNGPAVDENKPEYIENAIEAGFHVEIDVRMVDNTLLLGHDAPQYKIPRDWLEDNRDDLWIHAKDKESLMHLSQSPMGYRYFWHSSDEFTLVSNGMVWCHNTNVSLNEKCVIPLIDAETVFTFSLEREWPSAICSDYVAELRRRMREYATTE